MKSQLLIRQFDIVFDEWVLSDDVGDDQFDIGFYESSSGYGYIRGKRESWFLMAWSNSVETIISAKGVSESETIAWSEFDFSCIQIILN